jgi:hypothetical protein
MNQRPDYESETTEARLKRFVDEYISESEHEGCETSVGDFVYYLVNRGNVYIVDGDPSAS